MATYDPEWYALKLREMENLRDSKQYASAASALARADVQLTKLQGDKAKAIQDFQKGALNAAADIESKDRVQYLKGLVALRELSLTAQIDFAKAAYLPDDALMQKINDRVAVIPPSDPAARNKAAWEMFYNLVEPTSGNVWGTYQAMLKNYGENDKEPAGAVTPDNVGLWRKRQNVLDKLETENSAAQNFNSTFAALHQNPITYAEWVRVNRKDPDDPNTREEFVRDLNLEAALPYGHTNDFLNHLRAVVKMPQDKLEKAQAFTTAYDEGIDTAKGAVEFWRGQLPRDAAGEDVETGDTFRDRLAAWVGRPETRQWAEANGLSIGQTVPLTQRIKDDIAAGKYPGHVFTKYGVYLPKPDDMVAFRKAYNQLESRPERQVFRAAGLGYGGSTVVEVGLKPPPDVIEEAKAASPKVVEMGQYNDGMVAKLSDGSYAASTDGDTWKPLPADAAQQLVAEQKVQMDAFEDDLRPFYKEPPPKMFVGAWRPPRYGDAPGSVRFVNPENGKEAYIAPQDVANQRFVNHAPGAHKPQPLDVVRKVATERLLKRAGLEQEPTPATGPAPTSATGPLPAPVRQAEPPKVPDVERMEQAQREENRTANEAAIRRADKALAMSRARAPLGNPPKDEMPPVPPMPKEGNAPPPVPAPPKGSEPPPVPKEVTTPTVTTPMLSTGARGQDVLRRKFRDARNPPPPPE